MERGEIRDIPEDVWQSELEKGHGRLERREIRVVTDIGWLEKKAQWTDIKSIIQYKSYGGQVGEELVESDRSYISRGDFSVEECEKYIWVHWSIENNAPWNLEVIFRENYCRVRSGNGAVNLNIKRNLALKRLRGLSVEKKRYSVKLRMIPAFSLGPYSESKRRCPGSDRRYS